MLGDIVRNGNALESRKVRVWKARCVVEKVRRIMVEQLFLPEANGDMAQMVFEMEQESVQRRLEEAEFEYLLARDGYSPLLAKEAEQRAAIFSLRMILKLQNAPEPGQHLDVPEHPLDVQMNWIHDLNDLDEELLLAMDGKDCYGNLD